MSAYVNEISQLVDQFYSPDNDEAKSDRWKELNKMLIETQNSPEAWQVLWHLMSNDKSTNVQYFGASTLYHKLTKQISQLDTESRNELRQKLLECLLFYLNQNDMTLITTRLISCLAVYTLQCLDSSWPNAIEDIVNAFQPDKLPNIASSKVIYILLQILNSLAEEFDTLHTEKGRRAQIQVKLFSQAEFVLFIVHKVLSEENISDEITKICMKCFGNWSQRQSQLVIANNHGELVGMALNALSNENTSHDASEALFKIYTNSTMSKHPKLILELLEKITFGLENTINQAIEETNLNFLHDIYYIIIAIGETHSRLILDTLVDNVSSHNIILKYLRLILKCSSMPGYFGFDETISDMPFNFWICFQDDIMGSDECKVQYYMRLFADIYRELIDTLMLKVQYPPNDIYVHEWDSDSREKFRCYRQDIGDIFMYCFNTLHTNMLMMLMVHFGKAFHRITTVVPEDGPPGTWIRNIEAVYFAFSSVAENIVPTEALYMPELFGALQSISFERHNSPLFMATMMSFISSFSTWLNYNTPYIPYVLGVISIALKTNNSNVLISATMALKTMVPECQMHLQPYAMQIIGLCEEHFNYPAMGYKEKARLMHTIATALSVMPLDVIEQTMDRILVPILKDAENILRVDGNADNDQLVVHVNGILMILSNLFSKLDVNLKETELEEGDELIQPTLVLNSAKNTIKPQPIYFIFEKLIPLFEMIASKYCADESIVENLCECIKKTVVTLLDDVLPLLEKILIIMHHIYLRSQSIYVLKISRQIFTLFHNNAEVLPKMQEFYCSIVQTTMEAFQKDFADNTYLAQVFYEEAAVMLKKCIQMYENPKFNILSLFDFATAGICLPEKSTTHHCCLFLAEFITQGRSQELFNRIINERFEPLLVQIFNAIAGINCSSSFALDYVVEILVALKQKYPDSLTRTLNLFIDLEGFPTKTLTRTDKENFIKSLLLLRNNKRKMKELIKAFNYTCVNPQQR